MIVVSKRQQTFLNALAVVTGQTGRAFIIQENIHYVNQSGSSLTIFPKNGINHHYEGLSLTD